jgi:hypothetical protein
MYLDNNILFLLDRDDDFFARRYKLYGVNVSRIYKNIPLVLKFIRRIHLKLNLPLYRLWLNKKWVNNLGQYNTIIIHASIIKVPVVKFINGVSPGIRVIFWYWNPVNKILPIEKVNNLNCEIWSFDLDDCKKYNLNRNTQFFFSNIKLVNKPIKYDVLFVGRDKGRLGSLLHLKKIFENIGLKCNFHIVSNSRFFNFSRNNIYSKAIEYEKVLDLIMKSKAILDFVSIGQSGLTIRPLEALFLKKKLITNDKFIKNLDFYHPNNIFVINEENFEDLISFINLPYVDIRKEFVLKYDFYNWLKRIMREI